MKPTRAQCKRIKPGKLCPRDDECVYCEAVRVEIFKDRPETLDAIEFRRSEWGAKYAPKQDGSVRDQLERRNDRNGTVGGREK